MNANVLFVSASFQFGHKARVSEGDIAKELRHAGSIVVRAVRAAR